MGFENIIPHISKLNLLRKSKTTKERAYILKETNTALIYAICSCCLNVLNGVVSLTKKQREALQPFLHLFIQLIDHSVSLETKRKLLIKRGGFLPKLLTIILHYGISHRAYATQ